MSTSTLALLRPSAASLSTAVRGAAALAGASERIVAAEQRHGDRMLHVMWQDGRRAAFPYVWLRDAAPAKRDRPRFVADLSVAVRPEQLKVAGDGSRLHIQWPPYQWVPYDSTWLRSAVELLPDAAGDWSATGTIDVQQHQAAGRVAVYHMDAVRERRTEIVAKLQTDGCVRLTGCHGRHPAGVMHLLGLCPDAQVDATVPPAETAICDVMGLHTGRPSHKSPPRWLAVQVQSVGERGAECTGALQVADGFAVATHVRRHYPADYQMLTGSAIEYETDDGQKASHPVVLLDDKGRPNRVVYNHALRSARLPCTLAHVDDYYGALQRFNAVAYQRATAVRPADGDLLLIDNGRMLHGNTAFRDEANKALCHLSETFFR